MQSSYTPQYGQHGNIIFSDHSLTTNGHNLERIIECSDIIMSEFESYSQKLRSIPVNEVHIMRKELDKPLSFFKSIFAKIGNIKEEHQFLILQTSHFLVSIDFYIQNRLVIRIGDRNFVFDEQKSQARRDSQILREESGLMWRLRVEKEEKLTIGVVLESVLKLAMKDFSQISHNGSHLSKIIFNIIQNDLLPRK